jgi:arylsulfatase A-like enzyme
MLRLLALSLFVLFLQSPQGSADKPNILWVFIEDMSPWIGCYGDKINADKTPNIDSLATRGVRFTRCYVPCPVCSPCRSAMITGAYQTTTGIHNHRSSRSKAGAIHLPKGITTVPQLFRKNGYDTFNSGKEDYNFVFKTSELYSIEGRKRDLAAWRKLAGKKPWFGQIQLAGGKSNTRKWTDKVDPDSVTPPPYFPNNALFRKWHAHHYDTVRQTDDDTRRIIENLKADGLLENTIIFWFTDHGNNHSLRAKQFCTEAGTHVPLIILGPDKRLKPGTVRTDLTSTLDIAATSLALAAIDIPGYFDGVNLFGDEFKPRKHVISARDRCDYTIDYIRSVRTDRYRYIRNFLTDRPLLQPQYRDNRDYTIFLRKAHQAGTLPPLVDKIFFGPRPGEELYDLQEDPHETRNLAGNPAFQKVLQDHREILANWQKRTDDKGQYPESDAGLREVLNQWKDKCVNPEYDRIRKKADTP